MNKLETNYRKPSQTEMRVSCCIFNLIISKTISIKEKLPNLSIRSLKKKLYELHEKQ